jgi:hypothetical protein
MSKRFLVESGYLARVGQTWFDHRATLILVENERVEVFRHAVTGTPPARIGSYSYTDLDPASPPPGLNGVMQT